MIRRILFPTLESKDLLGCPYPFEKNPHVVEFSRGDMRLTFSNGSQWWFVSLDDPERAEGPNVDYIHVDEARLGSAFGYGLANVCSPFAEKRSMSCSY